MKKEVWDQLNHECKILRRMERMLLASERQREAFAEDGLPEIVLAKSEPYLKELRKEVEVKRGALPEIVASEPLGGWVADTAGIGKSVIFLTGLLPPLDAFPNPAKLWKFIGLDVLDGQAPRRKKGTFAGYDSFSRAVAIARIGFPIEKCMASPYRRIYENRKEYTMITHPPIMEPGECEFCDKARAATEAKRKASRQTRERTTLGFDCSSVGGIHWTPGHRRMDAIRVMVKAVIVDLWLVENGKTPRCGGQKASDIHVAVAPIAAD